MKYFIDTEFLEGSQTKKILGLPVGKTNPTIDLISIGIVAEDGREYYAISKDFNLDEAWNRFDIRASMNDDRMAWKDYWIRENVLKPLMQDAMWRYNFPISHDSKFRGAYDFKDLKWIINKYGKTNAQIAEEVIEFINSEPVEIEGNPNGTQWLSENSEKIIRQGYTEPTFYGYYCDYDWVVFCWLFGRMIDLPDGLPMYCIDLKQMLDERVDKLELYYGRDIWSNTREFGKGDAQEKDRPATFKEKLKAVKEKHPDYPKQSNEHNALADARWNHSLYKFLQSI